MNIRPIFLMQYLLKMRMALLAANAPCFDSNEPSMERLLHVVSVQVHGRFVLKTHIYFTIILLIKIKEKMLHKSVTKLVKQALL